MPEILERIEKDLAGAMKKKSEIELLILRLLKTGIKNAEITKRPQKLTIQDEIRVLRGEMKKHEDSIEMFERGKRGDLAAKEKAELEVIQRYLPKEIGDKELKQIIARVLEKMSSEEKSNFGLVMKEVMKEVSGSADGKRAGEMVKERLSKM